MIDTDKYEGHLAHLDYELWAFTDFMNINATHKERCATDALLNDAPKLLAEVKRLRELLESVVYNAAEPSGDDGTGYRYCEIDAELVEMIEEEMKKRGEEE